MTLKEEDNAYGQDIMTEVSIRINELEERMKTTREKINLITRNFIFIKENFEEKVEKVEKENFELKQVLNDLKKGLSSLNQESEKWVRRDEIILIERMLKDFQPLEFVRRTDLEDRIGKNLKLNKKELLERNKNP